MGKGANKPECCTQILVHLVFDANQDDRSKSMLSSGVHIKGPDTDTYYSILVSHHLIQNLFS